MTMTETHFIVPRDSTDELTFAVVRVEIRRLGEDQGLGGICIFLRALKEAVTEWVNKTPDGLAAWEESSGDFNIGDLANHDLTFINRVLSDRHGVTITDIEVHSMDSQSDGWVYDTILVHEDQRPRVRHGDRQNGS
jgi:hypothetical protein